MENKVILKSKQANKSSSLQALQLTKISLIIFILGICVVGRRESTWPIVTWVLYSTYTDRFRPPKPSVSAVELRVYTATGELHIVKPEQLLTLPYDSLSHSIVEQAFNNTDIGVRDESRRYLINAVTNLVRANSEIETIQAWKISYQVEPLEVPPIQVQAPDSEVMLGKFSKDTL